MGFNCSFQNLVPKRRSLKNRLFRLMLIQHVSGRESGRWLAVYLVTQLPLLIPTLSSTVALLYRRLSNPLHRVSH